MNDDVRNALDLLRALPLFEQLRMRGVVAILARPLLVPGSLATYGPGERHIWFDSESTSVREISITIGHELGHTFFASEELAEEFGRRWAWRHRRALGEFIRRHFTTPSEEHQLFPIPQ